MPLPPVDYDGDPLGPARGIIVALCVVLGLGALGIVVAKLLGVL